MVDIEYIPENYKSGINIWTIIKILWIVKRLRFHARVRISGLLNADKVKKKYFCCWQNDTIHANRARIYIAVPQQKYFLN